MAASQQKAKEKKMFFKDLFSLDNGKPPSMLPA